MPQRFDHSVDQYIEEHTTAASPLLNELERQTYVKILRPQMVAGHLQGKVLEMLCRMIRPQRVLELGTFTGYSALCMAAGMPEGSVLHTIDVNDELEDFTRSFLNRSPYANRIVYHLGDARQIVPTLGGNFDLVFIDADKREYPEYYNLIIGEVRTGGFIVADDVLWYGKINGD
ncbi:MAG: O-methyltransferase, partial [Salinivirgaceae bacterium]|nr:O-methyltransferase [Salinivirgaceae bacterium]